MEGKSCSVDGRIDEEVVSDSVDVNGFSEVVEVSPLFPDFV